MLPSFNELMGSLGIAAASVAGPSDGRSGAGLSGAAGTVASGGGVLPNASRVCAVVKRRSRRRRVGKRPTHCDRAWMDSWLGVFGLDSMLAAPWSCWLIHQTQLERDAVHRMATRRRAFHCARGDVVTRVYGSAEDEEARRAVILGLVAV